MIAAAVVLWGNEALTQSFVPERSGIDCPVNNLDTETIMKC